MNAPIPFNACFPIFLPRSSHFTNLVINEFHLKVPHNGVRETLTELRSCFWVVKGRQAVKTVTGKCSVCKKIEGRSNSAPHSPPLPEFRNLVPRTFSLAWVRGGKRPWDRPVNPLY